METKRVKIVACEPRPNYHIWIRFDDGLEGEADLNHLVGKGVFEAWNSIEFFNEVRIDPRSDTVVLGEDIDSRMNHLTKIGVMLYHYIITARNLVT